MSVLWATARASAEESQKPVLKETRRKRLQYEPIHIIFMKKPKHRDRNQRLPGHGMRKRTGSGSPDKMHVAQLKLLKLTAPA